MKIYELKTIGIPDCQMSFGVYSTKEKAQSEFEKVEKKLKNEDEGYGYDYVLKIEERELK